MQRKRGELAPVREALSDLGGPAKAVRKASPQAFHRQPSQRSIFPSTTMLKAHPSRRLVS